MSGPKLEIYCHAGHKAEIVCRECAGMPPGAVRVGEVVKNEAGQVYVVYDGNKSTFDYAGHVLYAAPKTHG